MQSARELEDLGEEEVVGGAVGTKDVNGMAGGLFEAGLQLFCFYGDVMGGYFRGDALF